MGIHSKHEGILSILSLKNINFFLFCDGGMTIFFLKSYLYKKINFLILMFTFFEKILIFT